MTAQILRVSGLDSGGAIQAARELLAHRDRSLRRVIVVDDTAALFDHAAAYELLLTSNRMDHLLCVAVGSAEAPALGRELKIRIPPNISSQQQSAVLWVGDPQGIDVSLPARLADWHPVTTLSGLDYLLEVLSVDETFDKVLVTVRATVRDGVASPGLHLARADDETVSFAAALALAARRITAPGTGLAAGADGPYTPLLPAGGGVTRLAPEGELAGYVYRVGQAAAGAGKRKGGLLQRDKPDPRDGVVAVGVDLRAFRDRVMQLFTTAQSGGKLTEGQREQLARAGIVLSAAPRPEADQGGLPLVRIICQGAIRSGDPLPKVIRQLTLTAKELKHEGSASQLRRVEAVCPQALVGRLLGPPPRPAGKKDAEAWQLGLGLADAARAADGLAALVVDVARTEWTEGVVTADEVTMTRIVLDGVCKRLAEQATGPHVPTVIGAQAARVARLSDSLTPILFDLVDRVLAVESAAPSAGGQQAYDRARDKTSELLAEWSDHAAGKGDIFHPPFATSVVHDSLYAEDEIAVFRDALQYDPRKVMWQLCGTGDLRLLRPAAGPPSVVAFAPQLSKEPLGEAVPQDMTWTHSGKHAGLLRLVPLRESAISIHWTDDAAPREVLGDEPNDQQAEWRS